MIAVSLAACGGAETRTGTTADPLPNAVARARVGIIDAVGAGEAAEEGLPTLALRLRFNPADCDCPQWEVAYRGHWARTYLTAEDLDLLTALSEQAILDAEAEAYAVYGIVGAFADGLRLAETGLRYRTVELSEWPETQPTPAGDR